MAHHEYTPKKGDRWFQIASGTFTALGLAGWGAYQIGERDSLAEDWPFIGFAAFFLLVSVYLITKNRKSL